MHSKQEIRANLRQKRQNLTRNQQKSAAEAAKALFFNSDYIQQHTHFSVYIAHDGELDPKPLIEALWQENKHCYLPIIDPRDDKQLCFMLYEAETVLVKNRYGIEEPKFDPLKIVPISNLDVVLMPLVAFDKTGHRLGRGAGFYDRSFADRKTQTKPCLLGFAHAFQCVENLPVDPWDVPLDAVITDVRIY